MQRTLRIACLYTLVSGVLLGILYPFALTAVAHLLFPAQAAGSLITRNGQVIGSALIGQSFAGPQWFHGRPSAAGQGYDATASSGSNFAPTSAALVTRVAQSVREEAVGHTVTEAVPGDLVTASASGLDPDISPAAAFYQQDRVAASRHLPLAQVHGLILAQITQRQFGLLGEPRVNVLALNLALDHALNHVPDAQASQQRSPR